MTSKRIYEILDNLGAVDSCNLSYDEFTEMLKSVDKVISFVKYDLMVENDNDTIGSLLSCILWECRDDNKKD